MRIFSIHQEQSVMPFMLCCACFPLLTCDFRLMCTYSSLIFSVDSYYTQWCFITKLSYFKYNFFQSQCSCHQVFFYMDVWSFCLCCMVFQNLFWKSIVFHSACVYNSYFCRHEIFLVKIQFSVGLKFHDFFCVKKRVCLPFMTWVSHGGDYEDGHLYTYHSF
jgi:hypothetical protein